MRNLPKSQATLLPFACQLSRTHRQTAGDNGWFLLGEGLLSEFWRGGNQLCVCVLCTCEITQREREREFGRMAEIASQQSRSRDLDKLLLRPGHLVGPNFVPGPEV